MALGTEVIIVQFLLGIGPKWIHVGVGIGVMYQVKLAKRLSIKRHQHQSRPEIHDKAIGFGTGNGFVGTIVHQNNKKGMGQHP